MNKQPNQPAKDKDRRIAYLLCALLIAMFGLAYACVPLYRIFCQKTGFAGTPHKGLTVSHLKLDKPHFVRVQFTASVNRTLPWHFEPKQHEIIAKVGEPQLVFYKATNHSSVPIIGMATYNVSPDKTAFYFGKLHCFCFEEQRLEPNQTVDMPVLFTISTDMIGDPFCKDVKLITLSYTFFKLR